MTIRLKALQKLIEDFREQPREKLCTVDVGKGYQRQGGGELQKG